MQGGGTKPRRGRPSELATIVASSVVAAMVAPATGQRPEREPAMGGSNEVVRRETLRQSPRLEGP